MKSAWKRSGSRYDHPPSYEYHTEQSKGPIEPSRWAELLGQQWELFDQVEAGDGWRTLHFRRLKAPARRPG